MVKIVDGEIIREDDPRYKSLPGGDATPPPARTGAQVATLQEDDVQPVGLYQRGSAAGRGAGGVQDVFDFSRAPIAIAWEPPGQSLAGLPGLDVFGAHMQSLHLLLLVGATLMLGWMGLLGGLVIWVLYKLSSGPDRAQPGANPHGGNLPASFLERYMQGSTREYQPGAFGGPQPQQRSAGAGRGGVSSDAPVSSARQATRDAWAGRGRGQRLGNT